MRRTPSRPPAALALPVLLRVVDKCLQRLWNECCSCFQPSTAAFVSSATVATSSCAARSCSSAPTNFLQQLVYRLHQLGRINIGLDLAYERDQRRELHPLIGGERCLPTPTRSSHFRHVAGRRTAAMNVRHSRAPPSRCLPTIRSSRRHLVARKRVHTVQQGRRGEGVEVDNVFHG